jgi:hypothetical protein
MRAFLLLALALAQTACGAGWRRIEPQPPADLRPRQQVEVWHGGNAVRLHAVTLTAESVSGVPYLQPPECDSCRVTLPRQSVDSMRAGNPTAGFWKTVGVSLVGTLAAVFVLCTTVERCQIGE